MHGHQVTQADELVQLDVVHMAVLSSFGRMQDDEHVVVVGVHLRHTVSLTGVLYGQRMKPKHLREHVHCLIVTGGDIHPKETVFILEKFRQFFYAALLHPTVDNKANFHSTHTSQPGFLRWVGLAESGSVMGPARA